MPAGDSHEGIAMSSIYAALHKAVRLHFVIQGSQQCY